MNEKRQCRALPILLFLTLAAALLAPAPTRARAGEEARVLTLRPEKLRAESGSWQGPALPLSRDPFNLSREQINQRKSQEPREKSNAVAGLSISGIIWDKNKPQAVINGRLLSPGDRVNDSLIKQIHKDLVIFEQNGIQYTLWLESSPRPLPMKDKKN